VCVFVYLQASRVSGKIGVLLDLYEMKMNSLDTFWYRHSPNSRLIDTPSLTG